jgi:transcriptional regulator with XRE-family HTH domain
MSDLHCRLRSELSLRKSANPRFSLRRMASMLEMSPAHLSLFLAGKKGLSTKKTSHIAGVLDLPDRVLADFLRSGGVRKTVRGRSRKVLEQSEFAVISDWIYLAILGLAKTHLNDADPRSVACELNVPLARARDAIDLLRQKKLLTVRGGKLQQLAAPLRTKADVPSEQVRDYHRQNLRLAELKLEEVAVAEREFGSITFACDPRRLPALKVLLRQFLDESAEVGETLHATQVYILAAQLFPVTRSKENRA